MEEIKVYNFEPVETTITIKHLTNKQRSTIEKIEKFKFENHRIPKREDLAEMLNIAQGTISGVITPLELKGYNFRKLYWEDENGNN